MRQTFFKNYKRLFFQEALRIEIYGVFIKASNEYLTPDVRQEQPEKRTIAYSNCRHYCRNQPISERAIPYTQRFLRVRQ